MRASRRDGTSLILDPFKRALVRIPASTVADGLTTRSIGSPDSELTRQQHARYVEALRQCGLDVTVLPADDAFPDGHYVEDTAVIFRNAAFMCRPTDPSRAGEFASIADNLSHLNRTYLEGSEAHLEGGDVLFCADRVLVGLSKRTNKQGAEQLRHFLQTMQPDLRVDFVPIEGVLHLKTGLTELAPGILLHDPAMRFDFKIDFAQVVRLAPGEGYAASVLPVNNTVLIAEGYPEVLTLAEQSYQHVLALPVSEFKKMDGGLTCLSLRY